MVMTQYSNSGDDSNADRSHAADDVHVNAATAPYSHTRTMIIILRMRTVMRISAGGDGFASGRDDDADFDYGDNADGAKDYGVDRSQL